MCWGKREKEKEGEMKVSGFTLLSLVCSLGFVRAHLLEERLMMSYRMSWYV